LCECAAAIAADTCTAIDSAQLTIRLNRLIRRRSYRRR